MIQDGKRIAFARIPARHIAHSLVDEERGKEAGKIMTLFLRVRPHTHLHCESWSNCLFLLLVVRFLQELCRIDACDLQFPVKRNSIKLLPVRLSCYLAYWFLLILPLISSITSSDSKIVLIEPLAKSEILMSFRTLLIKSFPFFRDERQKNYVWPPQKPGRKGMGQSGWTLQAQIKMYAWLGMLKEVRHYKAGIPAGYDEECFATKRPPSEVVYTGKLEDVLCASESFLLLNNIIVVPLWLFGVWSHGTFLCNSWVIEVLFSVITFLLSFSLL